MPRAAWRVAMTTMQGMQGGIAVRTPRERPPLSSEIAAFYAIADEARRLTAGIGLLELVRTQEILRRLMPAAPAVVLDVGGAAGAHACWLARDGYAVHLIDPLPQHVEQARHASLAQPGHPLAGIEEGDARRLDFADGFAHVVLELGPLYHLTSRDDRLAALREARRVLKPGGMLFAAAISRFASALGAMGANQLVDPEFFALVERDLTDGQHRNPTDRLDWFTTAFFHRPEELRAEVLEAGFTVDALLGVEGPAWILPDFGARWGEPVARGRLLAVLRAIEAEPTLLGASAHVIAVGRKPA